MKSYRKDLFFIVTEDLSVGDTYKVKAIIYLSDLEKNASYRLVLINTKTVIV